MPNDNVKNGTSLEYWIQDSLYGIEFTDNQIKELSEILSPLRDQIENVMKLYDPNVDNWPHFRNALWSAMPTTFERKVTSCINKWLRNNEVKDLVGGRVSIS